MNKPKQSPPLEIYFHFVCGDHVLGGRAIKMYEFVFNKQKAKDF